MYAASWMDKQGEEDFRTEIRVHSDFVAVELGSISQDMAVVYLSHLQFQRLRWTLNQTDINKEETQ